MEELEKNKVSISASVAAQVNAVPSFDNRCAPIRERITAQKQIVLDLIVKEKLCPLIDTNVVTEIYDNALKCVDYYLKGDLGSSVDVLYKFFFTGYNYLKYKRWNEGDIVGYRIRETELKRHLFPKEEMFHIAFENRYKVSNQRFSISGYPCLYFSSTINCSWREIRPKKADCFNVVALCNKKLITLIDLRQRVITEGSMSNIDFYTLIVAWLCSFEESHPDGAFKESYIIPQMMTAALVKWIRGGWRDTGISQVMHPRGFIFTSSLVGEKERTVSENSPFDNYVIPVETDAEKGLCQALEGYFKYTEPISIYRNRRKISAFLGAQDTTILDEEGIRLAKFECMEHILKSSLAKL